MQAASSANQKLLLQLQAQWLAAHLAGRLILPPPEDMRAEMAPSPASPQLRGETAVTVISHQGPPLLLQQQLQLEAVERCIDQLRGDLVGVGAFSGLQLQQHVQQQGSEQHAQERLEDGSSQMPPQAPTSIPAEHPVGPTTPTAAEPESSYHVAGASTAKKGKLLAGLLRSLRCFGSPYAVAGDRELHQDGQQRSQGSSKQGGASLRTAQSTPGERATWSDGDATPRSVCSPEPSSHRHSHQLKASQQGKMARPASQGVLSAVGFFRWSPRWGGGGAKSSRGCDGAGLAQRERPSAGGSCRASRDSCRSSKAARGTGVAAAAAANGAEKRGSRGALPRGMPPSVEQQSSPIRAHRAGDALPSTPVSIVVGGLWDTGDVVRSGSLTVVNELEDEHPHGGQSSRWAHAGAG